MTRQKTDDKEAIGLLLYLTRRIFNYRDRTDAEIIDVARRLRSTDMVPNGVCPETKRGCTRAYMAGGCHDGCCLLMLEKARKGGKVREQRGGDAGSAK